MAADKLKQIGDAISGNYLGFIPTSNSTKPPHIANGLFRHCIGETCDTRDIHEWMFEDNAKNSTPSEEICKKYEELLQNSFQEKETNIKEFRFLLEEIFNQDNGAYAGPTNYGYSVMTISSHAQFPTVFSERSLKQLQQLKELQKRGFTIRYIIVSLNPYIKTVKISQSTQFFQELKECLEQANRHHTQNSKKRTGCQHLRNALQ